MKHFAHQAIDGRWHTVYRIPGCGSLHSVGDGLCRDAAEQEARRLNALHAREVEEFARDRGERIDRPLVAGFYSDADAA